MYNDTIKVANKIITYEDLYDIFSLMHEKLLHYKKVYQREEMQNNVLDYSERVWTFKDNSSKLLFDVDFYDDTYIKFDTFNSFLAVFQSRTQEIKSIHVHFTLGYDRTRNGNLEYLRQYIEMDVYESKMSIEVSLSSVDDKINDVYELIKAKVLQAPMKHDFVIKKRSTIHTVVGFALGFIPSMVLVTLLCLSPVILEFFSSSYVLYPISVVALTFLVSHFFSSMKLDAYYTTIVPPLKYVGYDSTSGKSIYKDDMEAFLESSEILIGKNMDNLKHRKIILKYYDKYKRYLPYEVGVLFVFSLLVLVL